MPDLTTGLFALLTLVSLALVFVFAVVASIYVRRLRHRESTPIAEDVGSATAVMRKLRKREPMTSQELEYARQVAADRGSPMALAIPGMIFMLGCFQIAVG